MRMLSTSATRWWGHSVNVIVSSRLMRCSTESMRNVCVEREFKTPINNRTIHEQSREKLPFQSAISTLAFRYISSHHINRSYQQGRAAGATDSSVLWETSRVVIIFDFFVVNKYAERCIWSAQMMRPRGPFGSFAPWCI